VASGPFTTSVRTVIEPKVSWEVWWMALADIPLFELNRLKKSCER